MDISATLVSVIMTVRGRGEFLQDAIASVVAQTHEELELIIVDDGVEQDIENALQMVKWKGRFVLLRSHGLGRGFSLNMGIANATGEWVAIMDADELWHREKVEAQLLCLASGDLDLVAARAINFQSSINLKKLFLTSRSLNEVERPKTLWKYNFLLSNPVPHSSVLGKKSLFLYDNFADGQFDLRLWFRALQVGARLGLIDKPLVGHRIHDGQQFEGKRGRLKYRWASAKCRISAFGVLGVLISPMIVLRYIAPLLFFWSRVKRDFV